MGRIVISLDINGGTYPQSDSLQELLNLVCFDNFLVFPLNTERAVIQFNNMTAIHYLQKVYLLYIHNPPVAN